MEARRGGAGGHGLSAQIKLDLRQGQAPVRRRAIKNLSFFLPFRGWCGSLHVLPALACLDGIAGFHYAR
jgi:hypothetical protein